VCVGGGGGTGGGVIFYGRWWIHVGGFGVILTILFWMLLGCGGAFGWGVVGGGVWWGGGEGEVVFWRAWCFLVLIIFGLGWGVWLRRLGCCWGFYYFGFHLFFVGWCLGWGGGLFWGLCGFFLSILVSGGCDFWWVGCSGLLGVFPTLLWGGVCWFGGVCGWGGGWWGVFCGGG